MERVKHFFILTEVVFINIIKINGKAGIINYALQPKDLRKTKLKCGLGKKVNQKIFNLVQT